MKIIIKNGYIATQDRIADIFIDNGKIIQIAQNNSFTAEHIIDATNQWVLPGLVDLCCRPHMLHPHGTTLVPEAQAALKRGFTALCIPPDAENIPASTHALPRLFSIGALTAQLAGENIADLTALKAAGCIAFSNAQKPIYDTRIVKHCYDYAATFDYICVIQPQDPWLSQHGVAHEGFYSATLGLTGIPTTAETIAIAQHLLLIEQSGIRAHFTCLSSKAAVDQIRAAKAKGLKVTADVAMHSLHLTEEAIQHFDANCHVYPPLRSEEDRTGLLEGLKDGTIDAICSDHRPLDSSAKLAPFAETIPGMSTLDTFLGLGLDLVNNQQLPLSTLLKAISTAPADIFDLSVGTDLCIINPHATWQVTDRSLYSQGKNTPFKDRTLSSFVTHTLMDGKIVYAAG